MTEAGGMGKIRWNYRGRWFLFKATSKYAERFIFRVGVIMANPALIEQPLNQTGVLIAPRKNASIMSWLEETGRFIQGDESDPNWSLDDELLTDVLLVSEESDPYDE